MRTRLSRISSTVFFVAFVYLASIIGSLLHDVGWVVSLMEIMPLPSGISQTVFLASKLPFMGEVIGLTFG